MAPSPRKPASTFDPTWHEPDVNFLNPASLPLQKIPRAWERAPKSPYARDRGYKKVWHKHGLRSHSAGEQTSATSAGEEEQDMSRSPTRAVKKLRLKNEDALGNNVTVETKKPTFSATRWDRRKSGLPRKKPHRTTIDLDDLERADAQEVEDVTSEIDDQEGVAGTTSEHESMVQPGVVTDDHAQTAHAAISRVSLSTNTHDSTFSFIFGKGDEEPSTHEDDGLVDHISSPDSPTSMGNNEPGVDEEEFTISTNDVVNIDVILNDTSSSPIPQHTPSSPHQISEDSSIDAVEMTRVAVDTSSLEQATSVSAPSPLNLPELRLERSEVKNMEEETSVIGLEAMMETSILVQAATLTVPEAVTLGQPEQPSELAVIDNHEEDAIMTEHDYHMEVSGTSEQEAIEPFNDQQTLDDSEINWESEDDTEVAQPESAVREMTVVQEVEIASQGLVAGIEKPCSEPQSLDESEINWESDSEIEAAGSKSSIRDKFSTEEAEAQGVTALLEDSPSKNDHALDITENLGSVENANESTTEVLEESTIQDTLNMENAAMNLVDDKVSTQVLDACTVPHTVDENVEQPVSPKTPANADEESTISVDDDMAIDSIADGLTLAPPSETNLITDEIKPKLRSPARPARLEFTQDDLTAHLDDDTALLKDFLTRAAASKLNKAHKAATIARRSSLSHRRDSDVIRHALASPRKVLEDKDVNSPSPQKAYDDTATLDLTQTLTIDPTPGSPTADATSTDADAARLPNPSSRRSTRTRKSRIPPPSSHAQQPQAPKSIPVRRTDGGEPIVLRRTEAQELGIITRTNTRKNKMGAISAYARVLKLATEKPVSPSSSVDESADGQREGAGAGERKSVKWDETLVYFQENAKGEVLAVEAPADVEMVDAPGEDATTLSISALSAKPASKMKETSGSTPRVRRLRGLGAANGTPGKGLLEPAASLLPEEVQAEVAEEKRKIAKPRARKLPVATSGDTAAPAAKVPKLEPAMPAPPPSEEQETKERKSRIATPRKGKIPVSKIATSTVPVDGKENRLATGLPKKALGVEGGLPRRRAPRKL